MNIKVFNIRLTKEFCLIDQNQMNEFLDSVEVKLTSTNFVTTGTLDYWSAVVFYDTKKSNVKTTEKRLTFEDLTKQEKEIFLALKEWRNDLAIKLDWAAYMICHNSHLIEIAKANPQNLKELSGVKGFGDVRAEKYGEDIIALLNTF